MRRAHFFDDGAGTEALALELLMGRARVIEVTSRSGIAAEDLAGEDLSEDVRILIKTRNSQLWGSAEFRADYVGVTESGAQHLVAPRHQTGRRRLSPPLRNSKTPGAPAHHVLLGKRHDRDRRAQPARIGRARHLRFSTASRFRIVGSDGAPRARRPSQGLTRLSTLLDDSLVIVLAGGRRRTALSPDERGAPSRPSTSAGRIASSTSP